MALPTLRLSNSEKQNLSLIGASLMVGAAVLAGGAMDKPAHAIADWATTSPTEAILDDLEEIGATIRVVGPVVVSAGVYMLTMQPLKRFVFS